MNTDLAPLVNFLSIENILMQRRSKQKRLWKLSIMKMRHNPQSHYQNWTSKQSLKLNTDLARLVDFLSIEIIIMQRRSKQKRLWKLSILKMRHKAQSHYQIWTCKQSLKLNTDLARLVDFLSIENMLMQKRLKQKRLWKLSIMKMQYNAQSHYQNWTCKQSLKLYTYLAPLVNFLSIENMLMQKRLKQKRLWKLSIMKIRYNAQSHYQNWTCKQSLKLYTYLAPLVDFLSI